MREKSARTAPPEIRRRQLITATITVIAREGLSGTTLTAVTKEAGVSLGLVNFHFRSKEALFTATLEFLADEHRALWRRELRRAELGAADKLRAIVNAQFHPRICSRKKLAVWFAFFGEAKHRAAYRESSARFDMERQDVITGLFREIIAEGGYEGVVADGLSLTLDAMLDGFWLNMLMYPKIFTREGSQERVIAYLQQMFPQHFPETAAHA